jgi:F-type H+-transporting ATPase subunit delta
MRKQILVRRYGRGLINALADETEFRTVLQELKDMAGLFFSRGELRAFLASPFVVKAKKARAVTDILVRTALNPKTTRFLLLVLEHGRLDILPEVIETLPALWNERQGVLTCRVASVVPLTEAQKKRLQERLEDLEGLPVSLTFVIEPGLIGGLTITKGHVVYDISMKGQVERLKEIITEG